MKKQYLILFLVGLVSLACNQSNEQAQLEIDLNGIGIPYLILSNPVAQKYDTINISGKTVVPLDVLSDGEIYNVSAGRFNRKFFIAPGESVVFSNANGMAISVGGSLKEEQDLLMEVDKQLSIANMKYGPGVIASKPPEEFANQVKMKYTKLDQLLSNAKANGISNDLVSLLEGRILAAKANDYHSYAGYHKAITKQPPNLPDGFLSSVSEYDINNEELYYFEDALFTALTMVDQDLDFSEFGGADEFYAARYAMVDEKVENPKVVEMLKYNILMENINYGGVSKTLQPSIENYMKTAEDKTRKLMLNQEVAKWSHLQKGEPAPDFTALDLDGNPVKLSDFEGKNVYIDVWATWCGPCIAEIPALKEAEQKYGSEELEFMSVSIDAPGDREKWMRMVKEKNLEGTQIMAENGGQSEISKKYNINGIPRFIMVAKDGSIVDAKAPRPSDKAGLSKLFAGLAD